MRPFRRADYRRTTSARASRRPAGRFLSGGKRRQRSLFFVCRQQTIVWWEHTIVWRQHTIVWRQQTTGRWVRGLRWSIVARLLYYGLRTGIGRRQPLPHRPRSRVCASAAAGDAKGRKGLTGKRNTAAAAFLAQLLPPQTSEACN
ncbi:hypothetical protein [Alloprevotella tannerae]|uniref:hypothetical protein n=1 Tax=Alloprevotella tannerae TaxID=76122 RepID=UPI0028E3FE89|nr:hypothetical protein [Alloprevotella tannerae]